jgi:uncharacterized protein YndB with AHSA1/START domain
MEKPFEIERTFPVTPARLWSALTDPDEIKNWYFNLPGFKPEVGYKFEFMGGRPDGIQYRHLCEVTEVIPEKRLSYSWRYDGYEGNSEVTWELFPEGTSTRLKLTHSGLETFPKSNPDLAAKNFAEGWTGIIGKSLEAYLSK